MIAASLTRVDDAILVLTRLVFGSTPLPTSFCLVAKILYDLANDIAECQEWDQATLRSPLALVIPPTKPIRLLLRGTLMKVTLDRDNNIKQGRHDIPLTNLFLNLTKWRLKAPLSK